MTRPFFQRTAGLLATVLLPIALALPATALAGGPANNAYGDAETIGSLPATIVTTTAGAASEPGEVTDLCAQNGLGPSIWYAFTPSFTGAISVDTIGSEKDAELSIYRGTSLAGQTLIGCSGDIGNGVTDARVTALVTAGSAIRIRVLTTSTGPVTVHVKRVTPPTNDGVTKPKALTTFPVTVSADNITASFVPGEKRTGPCPEVRGTRWYSVTLPATKTLRADTWGASIDTIINVYRKTASGLKAVGCSDDSDDPSASTPGPQAAVAWVATKGVTYLLQVGGYRNQSGAIPLRVRSVTRPANDDLATATLIDGTTGLNTRLVGSIVNATAQPGEGASCDANGAIASSVWFRWTAPSNVTMHLAEIPSAAAVFTGSTMGTLKEIACADTDVLQWVATAGTTYRIRVFGTSGRQLPFDIDMIQE